MYQSNENLAEEPEMEGGYLDVAPEDAVEGGSGYLDVKEE